MWDGKLRNDQTNFSSLFTLSNLTCSIRQYSIYCLIFICTPFLACNFSTTTLNQILQKGKKITISYQGADAFKQGDSLVIAGSVLIHDSLSVFKNNRPASPGRYFLPTKKFVISSTPEGRNFYGDASAISILYEIGLYLTKQMPDSLHQVDMRSLVTHGSIVITAKNNPVHIQYPAHYSLLIKAE
jgi:hypothetical protein